MGYDDDGQTRKAFFFNEHKAGQRVKVRRWGGMDCGWSQVSTKAADKEETWWGEENKHGGEDRVWEEDAGRGTFDFSTEQPGSDGCKKGKKVATIFLFQLMVVFEISENQKKYFPAWFSWCTHVPEYLGKGEEDTVGMGVPRKGTFLLNLSVLHTTYLNNKENQNQVPAPRQRYRGFSFG
jgi:hypothetical protein